MRAGRIRVLGSMDVLDRMDKEAPLTERVATGVEEPGLERPSGSVDLEGADLLERHTERLRGDHDFAVTCSRASVMSLRSNSPGDE
ncbi:MAG: hypothetical protein HY791_21370 [Deltaproteobacteria bacterium]|nr:hypothetical protein [Deltaproteobacteria bacterium]